MKKLLLMISWFLLPSIGIAQTLEFSGVKQAIRSHEVTKESPADIKRKADLVRSLKLDVREQAVVPQVRLLGKSKSGADDATIILQIAEDSPYLGYQMLLDSEATTYGAIISSDEWTTRLSNGDMSEEAFGRFDYTIPTDASRMLADSIVVSPGNSGVINISPGKYDFCITYPKFDRFGSGFWFARGEWGRRDDYEFEKGYTYTFAIATGGDAGFYPPLNLKAESLELPDDGILGENEVIKLLINNVGIQEASDFKVSYQINDREEVTESVTATIAGGESLLYTFNTKVNMALPGLYTVKAGISWEKDMEISNNTITSDVKYPAVAKLPFEENFVAKANIRAKWSILDHNNDGYSWEWEPYNSSDGGEGALVYRNAVLAADADDYIVSDPIILPQRDLHVNFDYIASVSSATEVLEVLYGSSADLEKMTLLTRLENINNTEWKKEAVNFNVQKEGTYYLAFHVASSQEKGYGLSIDAISVDTGKYLGYPELELVNLQIPASSCDVQDTWSIKAVVGNNGNEGIYSFKLNLQIDDKSVISQEYTEYIAPGESKTVEIWSQDGAFSFPEKREYTVKCWGECERDTVPDNNSVELKLYNYEPITELPFYSRFDNEESASDWYVSEPHVWVYDSGYTTYENYIDSIPLVSRCIHFEPGSYRVKLRYSAGLSVLGYVAKENFLMMCGVSGTDPMNWNAFMDARDEYGKDLIKEAILKISEAGEYCIAIMTTEWENLDMGLLSVFEVNVERIADHDLQLISFRPFTLPAQIPSGHLKGNHSFETSVLNQGVSVEQNVRMEVKDGKDWLVTSAAITSLEPEKEQKLSLHTELPAWKTGENVKLHIKMLADNDVSSNELVYAVSITDTVFAQDRVKEFEEGVGAKTPLSFGNVFTVMEADTLTSMSVGFIKNSMDIPVDIAVYRLGENNKITSTLLKQSEIRPKQAGLHTYVLSPRVLSPGKYYFEISQKGDENILVACDNEEDGAFYATLQDSLVSINKYGSVMIRANFGHEATIYDYDIAVDKIIRPAESGVLKRDEVITAAIINNGCKAMENIPVYCSVNGSELALETLTRLEPYESKEVSFVADLSLAGTYQIKVHTAAEGDMNTVNDALELSVTCNQRSSAYEMNFEECEDFAVSGFTPEWTIYDGDGAKTERFQAYLFPHNDEPMSFIAFNPWQTTPSMELTTAILPHSGLRFGACFSAHGVQNDDWLISPKLQLGSGSSMTLYVKSYVSNYGLETYQILVSETDNQPGSFISIGGERTAPSDDWEKVEVNLSTYDGKVVYVAVRCISEDAFVFMVDDIRVSSSLTSIEDVSDGEDIWLYPNPVRRGERVNISSGQDILSVNVYDTTGRLILTEKVATETYLLDTSGFTNGVYVVRVEGKAGMKNFKLIVTE